MDPRVGRRSQDAVDTGDVERLAVVLAAGFVQLIDDRLDTERHAGAAEREIKDAAHHDRLRLVDGQHLPNQGN